MTKTFTLRLAAAAALTAGCLATAQAAVVLPNNPGGDNFTNPGASNAGQAVGATGWYYNNVRNGGTVGINGSYPHLSNGSVYMSGGTNAKGDIEYLAGAVNVGGNYFATQSLGSLSSLTSMQYDWYRSSTSINNADQHPSMRVYIDRDGDLGTLDRGYLIFELVYNGLTTGSPVTTDAWVSQSIGLSTNLWSSNGFGFNGTDPDGGYAYDTSLAEWQAAMPSALILGFSSGFGSGWGPFSGAVDNIGWTIAGVASSTNFEVTAAAEVPEPGSLALAAGALLGAAAFGRRRSRRAAGR